MSMLNQLTNLNAEAIAQSDTTEYGGPDDAAGKGPLKFLQVWAVNGTVKIRNGAGDDVTYTIPANTDALAPVLIFGLITKVYATDTTIADAALIGYR